ncbi:MAG: response regulator [Candidatus Manganitrophus sp.]|nr:response regulator [Candidatus Manganitrophus sp.]
MDDEADARDLVKTALRQCQAEVTAVGSVKEAMRVLAEEHPDILVSDIAMPDEDGYDLIQKIRALAPEQGGRYPRLGLDGLFEKGGRQENYFRRLPDSSFETGPTGAARGRRCQARRKRKMSALRLSRTDRDDFYLTWSRS